LRSKSHCATETIQKYIEATAKSAGDAFTDMANQIIRAIEQMIIKMMIVEPSTRSLQALFSGRFKLSGFGFNPIAGVTGSAHGNVVGTSTQTIWVSLADHGWVKTTLNNGTARFTTNVWPGSSYMNKVCQFINPGTKLTYAHLSSMGSPRR
jgi:hypothetical protein